MCTGCRLSHSLKRRWNSRMESEDHQFVCNSILGREHFLRLLYRFWRPPTGVYDYFGTPRTTYHRVVTYRHRPVSACNSVEGCGSVVSEFSRFPLHLVGTYEEGLFGLAYCVCTPVRRTESWYAWLICTSRLQSTMSALSNSSSLQELSRSYPAL